MNFITALARSQKGNNAIWVIVDRLMKSAHFIPFKLGQSTELLAEKYMQEVVRSMVCQSALCLTETLVFCPTSGEVSKKVWEPA